MIVINFASRSRTEKFFNCLNNIVDNIQSENFIILCSLDTDDDSMNNESVKNRIAEYKNVNLTWGISNNKIHAINRSMSIAPASWDVLINFSDDMLFIQKGFDEIIQSDIAEHFPHGDCLLHYPDQNQGENCMTMSIMDKKYFDRDKFIYEPRCKSLWSDIIAQETAMMRGRYKFINKRLFNHYHPSFGHTDYDKQYRNTESYQIRVHDYNVYLQAKKEYDPMNVLPKRNL